MERLKVQFDKFYAPFLLNCIFSFLGRFCKIRFVNLLHKLRVNRPFQRESFTSMDVLLFR